MYRQGPTLITAKIGYRSFNQKEALIAHTHYNACMLCSEHSGKRVFPNFLLVSLAGLRRGGYPRPDHV